MVPPTPPGFAPAKRSAGDVFADDIPVANTPPGGYGNAFPPPVLAKCTEPLIDGAPDLRGIWKAVHVERDGHMLWERPDQDFAMTLERIGGPNDPFTRKDLPDSSTGGSGLPLDK
ncbi:MAG: hypothetical protein R3E50_14695 [Halioglobus sp.]